MVVSSASAVPPTAAVASPRPKPNPATRSVSMPTSRAASRCWMVARRAQPNWVLYISTYSVPSATAARANAISLTTAMRAPKSPKLAEP